MGKACALGGGGEPLIYPHFVASVKHFLGLEFELGISTNGSKISPEIAGLLSNFAWVRISIDACTDKTYQKLRHTHDSFNQSFRYVDKIRRGGCTVGGNFVIQPENIGEITEFAKIVKEAGFDNCRYSVMYTPVSESPYNDSQLDIIKEQLARAYEYEDKNFKLFVRGRPAKRWHRDRGLSTRGAMERTGETFACGAQALPSASRVTASPCASTTNTVGTPSAEKKDYRDCYYGRIVLAFAPDECLYSCCTTKESPDFKIGCLHNMSLSSLLQRWKQHFPVDVAKCPSCWWDDKNKIAEYLLSENPPHVNFP